MLDKAFEALKSYDWGVDRAALDPINDAVTKSHGDNAARKELESRLTAALTSSLSRDAKDFVCRKLMQIGAASCVPALAAILGDKEHSHMARFALERNPSPEAAKALRDALPIVSTTLQLGIISSLGQRRDSESVALLSKFLVDSNPNIVRSAALALGLIRTPESAKALATAKPTSAEAKRAVTDAILACAESLLASGNTSEATAMYKSLLEEGSPKHVRLAATRGMLICSER